jgi:outer membrane protein OmpA-like peptidoglycan-associated protein
LKKPVGICHVVRYNKHCIFCYDFVKNFLKITVIGETNNMKGHTIKTIGASFLALGLTAGTALAGKDLVDQWGQGQGATLTGSHFDSGRATLKASGMSLLRNHLSGFRKAAGIVVTGHTDSDGSDSYNMDLSKRRANTVRGFLRRNGVRGNISTIGMGESSPIADNSTPEGKAKNRRVTVKYEGSRDYQAVIDREKNCIKTMGGADVCGDVVLDSASFDTASAVLKPGAIAMLNEHMGDFKDARGIKITGHTDNRGSDSYNQSLSQRRANAVAEYLRRRGVRSPIAAVGMGESNPIASNDTPSGMAKNRRIEIKSQ